MRIALFGPPGAGKGTVSSVLVGRTGVVHIATGDLLRAEIKSNSELGEQARGYMERGELVPDDLVVKMLEGRISQPDASEKGFILDGFPRTIPQAQVLDKLLAERHQELEAIFDLQVEEELIIRRLSGRIICPSCQAVYNVYTLQPKVEGKCDRCGTELVQRADDKPEAISVRFRAYRAQTEPLLEYYRPTGLLRSIDASQGAEASTDRILQLLAEAK